MQLLEDDILKLTTVQMTNYLDSLQSIAEKVTGRLGYAVSRNMRKLTSENIEFLQIRNDLLNKYGTVAIDEDGIERISVNKGTDAYDEFMKEITEYTSISHDIDICMVDEKDIYTSSLNAKEMMAIDFMIQENKEETE